PATSNRPSPPAPPRPATSSSPTEPGQTAGPPVGSRLLPQGGDDIAFAGLARQAEMVRAGEVSPTELVGQSLERIDRLDPELNAFRKVFADKAMLEAEQAEARRSAGDKRPLLGVPIAIKDEVDVAGEINTHG